MHVRALLGLTLMMSVPLSGQSVMTGIVRTDSTGAPLPGVEVLLEGTAFKTTTGANGRYLLDGLPPGRRLVLFRMVGHLPVRIQVLLGSTDTTRVNATLIPSSTVLDPIMVTARRPEGEGREGFEERRKLGFGKFYDSLVVRKSEHLRLDDLLRRQGSVDFGQLNPNEPRVAYNPNRRDPMSGKLNCPMQVYYNGTKMGTGGRDVPPDQRFDINLFDLANLESIEVYRSAGQVPAMYSGPTADCGVILLWSRQQ